MANNVLDFGKEPCTYLGGCQTSTIMKEVFVFALYWYTLIYINLGLQIKQHILAVNTYAWVMWFSMCCTQSRHCTGALIFRPDIFNPTGTNDSRIGQETPSLCFFGYCVNTQPWQSKAWRGGQLRRKKSGSIERQKGRLWGEWKSGARKVFRGDK